MSTQIVNANIFNANKDYKKHDGSMFLQDQPGLLDSINKRFPRIWQLYKDLKQLDWDENEFNYGECMVEFQTGNQHDNDKMIASLAWQWETDSIAAHNLIPLYAPFVSSSELWAAIVQVGQNEIVHGLTYSEIVNNSFEDPDAAMRRVLDNTEPLKRLKAVTDVFAFAREVGLKLSTGQITREDPLARDGAMALVCALFVMERIQFMASFPVTFAFGEVGRFMPICKAVQKICNEEFSIHVEIGRAILRNELSLDVGKESFERIKPMIVDMIKEVVQSEVSWTRDYLFADGRQLTGCTDEMVIDFVYFGAADVCNELKLNNPFKIVTKNPIPYMDDWIAINSNQASPQEEKTGNYRLGGFENDTDGMIFDVKGI